FLANIVYVSTARTTLIVLLAMLVLFGVRQFGWRGAVGTAVIGAVLAGVGWVSSPYLRQRGSAAVEGARAYGAHHVNTPGWFRLRKLEEFLGVFPLEARNRYGN